MRSMITSRGQTVIPAARGRWGAAASAGWPIRWLEAIHCGATLLHKHPEFPAIDGLAQEWLA